MRQIIIRNKEWLYSQQCYLERWYGTVATALPEGILNLMDCLQDVWEEKEGSEDSKGFQFSGKQVDVESSYWYKEVWTDEDLVNALENAEIDVTEDNVKKLKQKCLHIFDDKSERNELLANRARSIWDI